MLRILAVAGGGFAISAVAFLLNPGLGLLVFLFMVPVCEVLIEPRQRMPPPSVTRAIRPARDQE
jgi:hypothetical protein